MANGSTGTLQHFQQQTNMDCIFAYDFSKSFWLEPQTNKKQQEEEQQQQEQQQKFKNEKQTIN